MLGLDGSTFSLNFTVLCSFFKIWYFIVLSRPNCGAMWQQFCERVRATCRHVQRLDW